MKKPVVIRIYKGEILLGAKQFLDEQIIIGRPGDVQLPLDGEKVSPIHAAIEERGEGTYFVSDLGSESGTFKNGESVLDAQLESGDIIHIGEFRIEFFIGAPKTKVGSNSGVGIAPLKPETQAPAIPLAAPAPVSAPAPVPVEKPVEKPAVPLAKPYTPPSEPYRPPPPAKPVIPPVAERPAAPKPVTPKPAFGEAQKPNPQVSSFKKESGGVVTAKANPSSTFSVGPTAGGGSAGLAGPGPRSASAASRSKSSVQTPAKKSKTFAPPSRYGKVTEYVKPSKGTVVEVLVAWRERIISTTHFTKKQIVTIGSHPDCDIVLPVFASRDRKVPLVRIDARATVLITPEMTGELVRGQSSSSFAELLRQNRMVKETTFYALALDQGEMARVELSDQISVVVRYVSDSPKPLVAPLLDFTTTEATGVVLACAVVAVLWLYTFLYTPAKPLIDDAAIEPVRTALIIVPPTPVPLPEPVEKVETPPPPPQPVVHSTPTPNKQPVASKTTVKQVSTNLTTKNDNGKAANAAPNPNKTSPRQLTSPKQGGAVKNTEKPAAQIQSPKRDVTKSGVFSVFGGGGAQDKLSESTSGAGELAGVAAAATGKSGYAENRQGQGLGSATKDTGQGGSGVALTGISGGVGTQGRGSGNSGYGTGGLGNHAGVKIVTGGTDESVHGSIDRDAIRRVILANLRVIKSCYERQLNQHPDLLGKIVLSWSIGEQGRVQATSVKSNELGNKEVAQCVMDHLRTWKFPEPPANEVVDVDYPFFFSN